MGQEVREEGIERGSEGESQSSLGYSFYLILVQIHYYW